MKVTPVPVLSDNYSYLLTANDGTTAAIDPAEPSKVITAAEREGLKISSVLTTHHHWYFRHCICLHQDHLHCSHDNHHINFPRALYLLETACPSLPVPTEPIQG